jgi:hypothetical protein
MISGDISPMVYLSEPRGLTRVKPPAGSGADRPDFVGVVSGSNWSTGAAPKLLSEDLSRQLYMQPAMDELSLQISYSLWGQFELGHVVPRHSIARLKGFEVARMEIKNFGQLGNNWDGYGASRISPKVRDSARRVIDLIEVSNIEMPAPEVSPLPTGTIALEWETDRAEAYLEIGSTRFSGYIVPLGEEPIYLQGSAEAINQNVVEQIYEGVSAPRLYGNTVSRILVQELGDWWSAS